MTSLPITKPRPSGQIAAPSPIDPHIDRLVGVAFNGLHEEFGDLTIYADRAPKPHSRLRMEARLRDLRAGLTPATEIEIRRAYGQVLDVLTPRKTEGVDAEAARRGIFATLGDLPSWAIVAACGAYLRGEVGDGHWAPTATEIRQAAKRRMRPYEDEIGRIERVLRARVVDAPRRLA